MFLSITVLSLRPGGIKRQLRFAARRLRIALVLGGIYLFVNAVIRLVLRDGFVVDWGPPVLAVVLAVAFLILGQDPAPTEGESPTRT